MNPINVDRFGKAIVTTIGIVFICVVKNAKKPLQKVGTKILSNMLKKSSSQTHFVSLPVFLCNMKQLKTIVYERIQRFVVFTTNGLKILVEALTYDIDSKVRMALHIKLQNR